MSNIGGVKLAKSDFEHLRPYVEKTVERVVGSPQPSLISAAIELLSIGADRTMLSSKLASLHPPLLQHEKAGKLSDLLLELAKEYANSIAQQMSKKRIKNDPDGAPPPPKVTKMEKVEEIPPIGRENVMTADKVREMMAQAQKLIEERKKALILNKILIIAPTPPPALSVLIPPPIIDKNQAEKMGKLGELQAKIQSKLVAAGIKIEMDGEGGGGGGGGKPAPLLLDSEGRAIDMSGKQVFLPTHQPTLKANLRAQRKNEFKSSTELGDEPSSSSGSWYDERLSVKVERGRKGLKFNEPGKYVAIAHKQRMQAQLQRLQQEIADKARKTGISTAARLAKLSGAVVGSKEEKNVEYIPQVEWWDSLLLDEDDKEQLTYDSKLKEGVITKLIEHPTQLRCPTDPLETPLVPVFLTKKEMKKLRRQNRRENWKEMQEKIRLGLEPSPAPKVRISNLMRVLGVEAVSDPTKIEAHVRKEMAKRAKTHVDANANRKLTPQERRDKKARKLKEDVSLGVHVSVYRVDDLTNQSKKFKVDTNAKQLTLTGIMLLFRECNLVIVEGGAKQQKKYRQLMLSRIKWSEDEVKEKSGVKNKAVLVWEGTVKERSFSEFKTKIVPTEEGAREFLKKYGVENYWDLAISGSVLESLVDN